MTIFLGILFLIIWLNVGILAERSMGDLSLLAAANPASLP